MFFSFFLLGFLARASHVRMDCHCNAGVHDDFKENVLFGLLVLSNGELAEAQFWFPSAQNPKPCAGVPYSLKLTCVQGQNQRVYEIFRDDKFIVEAFSLDKNSSVISLIVPPNLMRMDGWNLTERPLEYDGVWRDASGKGWDRDRHGRYWRINGKEVGYKLQFIPRPCCSKINLLSLFLTDK